MKKLLLILFFTLSLYGQTIEDISNIVGIRDNQLIGNGLVVGLATGDGSALTERMLKNLMTNSFLKDVGTISADSAAAVTVTAVLPAFARQGDKIKVEVSTIASPTNLDYGQLLITQLKGIDGKVYAVAQGKVIANTIPGVNNRPSRNQGGTGYIYEGAIVENELEYKLSDEELITLSLINADAKVAATCEEKINEKFGSRIAVAYDTRTIEVKKPKGISMVRFIAEVQGITIGSIVKKKVIIDSRRETIVSGADITISPITIARDNFTIRIKKSDLSDKQWEDPDTNVGVDIGDDAKIADQAVEINLDNAMLNTKEQPTVSDLMRALKTMKTPISEIIETIKMLDSMGAINADVEMVR